MPFGLGALIHVAVAVADTLTWEPFDHMSKQIPALIERFYCVRDGKEISPALRDRLEEDVYFDVKEIVDERGGQGTDQHELLVRWKGSVLSVIYMCVAPFCASAGWCVLADCALCAYRCHPVFVCWPLSYPTVHRMLGVARPPLRCASADVVAGTHAS